MIPTKKRPKRRRLPPRPVEKNPPRQKNPRKVRRLLRLSRLKRSRPKNPAHSVVAGIDDAEALTAGLQKVAAQLEMKVPSPQIVNNEKCRGAGSPGQRLGTDRLYKLRLRTAAPTTKSICVLEV